jgi:hypothetical protein
VQQQPATRILLEHLRHHLIKLRLALERLLHAQVPVAVGGDVRAKVGACEMRKGQAVVARDERGAGRDAIHIHSAVAATVDASLIAPLATRAAVRLDADDGAAVGGGRMDLE